MEIDSMYLELSFDKAGIRDSQKRLKELIDELAVEPLKSYQDTLADKFDLIEKSS
jgi:hypothetical protein